MIHLKICTILTAGLLLTGCYQENASYHYDIRQDLSIYFTNSDAVIQSIRDALRRRDWRIIITYTSHADNMEDLHTIVRELMDCALSETENPEEGDYILQQYGGYEMQFQYQIKDNDYFYEIYILPQYYTTAEQETQVTEKIQEILYDFDFDKYTTDYEKVRMIYDYVLENVSYDKVHAKNNAYHLKTTAYAALFQKQAVCQGYAVLLYRLLREADVQTRIITGMAVHENSEEPHAWNIVCIDGVYYNLDATWDSISGTENCFLKCDANFAGHVRDEIYADTAFYEQYPMAQKDYEEL